MHRVGDGQHAVEVDVQFLASAPMQASIYAVPTPFREQNAFVEAQLELTRGRIRFALDQRDRRMNGHAALHVSPAEFREAEVHIAKRLAATNDANSEFPVAWLESRLNLDVDAVRLIWVLLAHELDPVARGLLRQLNTETSADPTTDTIRLVAFIPSSYAAASRLLASNSVLVKSGLIERADTDVTAADHRKTWKVARRIVALAHGDLSLDPEIEAFASIPTSPGEVGIGSSGIETDPDALPKLTSVLLGNRGAAPTVVVQGPRGTGRRTLLRLAADACCLDLIEADLEKLCEKPAQARSQMVALARECRLLGRVPLLRNLDALVGTVRQGEDPANDPMERLAIVMGELQGLTILATTAAVIPGNLLRTPIIIEPRPLSGSQRARLWHRALPQLREADADALATMYPIAPAMISAVSAAALAQLADGESLTPAHIRTGLRTVLDGQLALVASRVETTQTWDALVLPPEQQDSINELLARVRRRRTVYETWGLGNRVGRGLGVAALFSGPPGTGRPWRPD